MVVETGYGRVSGKKDGSILVFRGIPYASPPVGELRFQPPAPPSPWSHVLSAESYRPMAPQSTRPTLLPRAALLQSEDCLTLNVWTPAADSRKRPVLVWVHGGGLTTGSGADPYSQGHHFAQDGDMVFVSVNYRLGALGFLHLGDLLGDDYASSGNSGILDIIQALRWVRDHIDRFGGDPSRVTVGGVSAGAKCVASLFSIPEASNLFQQAILQSGAAQTIRDRQTASSITEELLAQLGLRKSEANQVLTMPVPELLAGQERLGMGAANLHLFGPVLDGTTLLPDLQDVPKLPKDQLTKPVLIGSTLSEAQIYTDAEAKLQHMDAAILERLFGLNAAPVRRAFSRALDTLAPQEAVTRVLSDYMYSIASERFADHLAGAGASVWRYRFDWQGEHGACHAQDIPFVWNFSANHGGMFYIPVGQEALAQSMHTAWIAFVQTGNPTTAKLPSWPLYTAKTRQVMSFNATCQVITLPRTEVESDFRPMVFVR